MPLAFAAFGNYVVPLMIGAPDMAFPRVNMASYQAYFLGGVVMLVSFFIPGGAAQAGWTSYSPLATTIPTHGQVFWIIGMVLLISSSLLGAVNFIATIIQLRAPGMTWMRLPFFVWAQFVTAFILLLAFPPLEAAAVMQLMDNVAHTSFFLPTGLAVGGKLANVSGGGSPLLWQHLFWFLGHPEVYVLILPAMGIVCEIIANNTRKPIWGYKSLVYSVLAIGFLSFIVWAHHMYLTGMGTKISTFFQATTMIISIPSVIILTCLFISLWGGSIRFNTPMLFALAFLPMFGIGGLTGLPLGFNVSDVHLHDTYYIIAHFHYVVAPGTIFALFAGVYYWYPKMTGRKMNEFWGRVHFWCSLVFMNLVFMPMFAQGMAGMLRRMARRRRELFRRGEQPRGRGSHRRVERQHHVVARLDSLGGHRAGHRANSIHHQYFLEHQARRKSRRQSVALHDARMADAHAAAARQFRARAARLSRALRIQRSRACHAISRRKMNRKPVGGRPKISTPAH